jgi:predicted amidophosphoribosyltransferase
VGDAWWHAAARDLLGLVLPVSCAGCGADDVPWCDRCAQALARPPWRAEERAGRLDRMDGRPPVPVWAVADFAGPVRRAVSAWKDHGHADLTPVLGAAARRATRALVAEVGTVLAGPGTVLVVPAPSTPAARRRRGWDPAGALAAAVADELVRRGLPARRAPVLRRSAGADQAGLSARARSRNLSGHVRVRRWPATLPGRAVLVDDVLTTGATFAACVRALEVAGIAVAAGVVVASTPSPGDGAIFARPTS